MPQNLRTLRLASMSDRLSRAETRAWLRSKSLRRACYPSQLAAAEDLGISAVTVQKYEARKMKIPARYLVALEEKAEELGVEVARPLRRVA